MQKSKYELGRCTWEKKCEACLDTYQAWRKHQVLCIGCYSSMQSRKAESKNTNQYVWQVKGKVHEHRYLAEQVLGRKLQTNEVVHHINDDPKDNRLENLMVLDRRSHSKLHIFLDLQRVIWEKSQNENHGNCWNSLIAPITTTWLETTGVKVIRIWEIGQSAAEPLKQECNEEGSETKLVTS